MLDTHFVVWLALERHRIRPDEQAILRAATSELLVSALSLWEIRIKWNTLDRDGNRKGRLDPHVALAGMVEIGCIPSALRPEDCLPALVPSLSHRDPFDELLLVHARQLDAKLFTRDRLLVSHPLAFQP